MRYIKKTVVLLGCIFIFAIVFSNSDKAKASYYNGRENYLGFTIDAVTAPSISQDSIKTTAGIFEPTFLNSRVHIALPARTTLYDTSSGFSSTEFFDSFNSKVSYYQGLSGAKGAFAYGESLNFELSVNTDFSEYNSVYFNRTSYLEVIGGYGLDECTSNPELYANNLRSSFLTNLNKLPTSYNKSTNYYQFVNFFQTYGTHVVCKAYYGGRVDVYKTVTSNEKNFDSNVRAQLSNYFNVTYKDIISGTSSQEYSLENELKWSSSQFEETTRITAIGGKDYEINNDINELNRIVNTWKKTINYYNADLVDFGDNSLYPIYELVKPLNSNRANAMKAAYLDYLAAHYDTALELLKTNTPFLSNEVDVFDGTNVITDDGRWESPHVNVYFSDLNIDVNSLKNLGYNYFDLTLKIRMKEIHAGYQHIHIYDRSNEDGSAKLIAQKENYEYGGGGLADTKYRYVTFVFQDIPVSKITKSYFTIRARASGLLDDDWCYNDLIVKVKFYKKD